MLYDKRRIQFGNLVTAPVRKIKRRRRSRRVVFGNTFSSGAVLVNVACSRNEAAFCVVGIQMVRSGGSAGLQIEKVADGIVAIARDLVGCEGKRALVDGAAVGSASGLREPVAIPVVAPT